MRKIILLSFILFQSGIIRSQIKSLNDIQGDWTCVSMSYYMGNLATDVAYINDLDWVTPIRNMQIKGDQVCMFDYPCEYFYTAKISVDSGGYYYSRNEYSYINTYPFQLRGDTLIVEEFPGTITSYYIKDTFDITTVGRLKKDSINTDCLKTRWNLTTEYDSGYDGMGILEVIYPFKVPLELEFNSSNLSSFYLYGRFIQIPVNGTLKKFRIARLSLKENELLLEPKFWFKPKAVNFIARESNSPQYK